MGSSKVFILGLDGATFDIMLPLAERGELPNLAALMKDGVRAPLNSTVFHHSPPAWTSFATGKNPGKHGILGFTRIMPGTYELALVNGVDNESRTLWEVLGDYSKRVIVNNIPMTYPPKVVNGLLMAGLDTPSLSSPFTYPPELKEEILRVAPGYKINLHLGGYLTSDRRRIQALGMMSGCIQSRTKVLEYLMAKYPWDFVAVRFNSPDNVQHQYWKFMDSSHPEHEPRAPEALQGAIHSIYRELDGIVGRLRAAAGPEATFMVMSDHGAGPRSGKSVYLNEWLRSQGLLARVGGKQKGGLRRLVDDTLHAVKGKTISLLLQTLPPQAKNAILKLVPQAAGKTATYLRFSGIDWSNTKAFVGEVEGVRINLAGRYPQGSVSEAEYEPLRDRIISEAAKLTDPETGEKVFKIVCRGEEVHWGPWVKDFPDIVILPREIYNMSPRFFRGGEAHNGFVTKDQHWRKISGSHRQHGVFIMAGPDCRQGVELPMLEILDIFPTTLYRLGLPVPDDVDGRVATAAFEPEFVAANPVKIAASTAAGQGGRRDIYDEDDESKLIDSLRGLGYID
jgi:predicted AlkP superfamily phosphohydrolase/phosphomutase